MQAPFKYRYLKTLCEVVLQLKHLKIGSRSPKNELLRRKLERSEQMQRSSETTRRKIAAELFKIQTKSKTLNKHSNRNIQRAYLHEQTFLRG